ncbi:CDP-2,3-bis-(O-geranylgeranyl)-sn-glycerol synthase [Methanothermococcus sp.]|uniref:CDP-2,3-bis-(O-geranylgeranyl)-sn-glycerol synthase n=1 Tax=Methanothermococcus sp. TaxID=2614238 RepID=UPI0025FE51F1|nr:CDP-2,3-bis-(O-geranylgeranyl)-sn-glycerol synthase [Methanothermococcus sp.]
MNIIQLLYNSLVYILPAYIANASACIFGGGTPLDAGKHFIDGKRIIGNGVTYKGTFFGLLCGTIVAVLEGIIINLNIMGTAAFYFNTFEWAYVGFLLSLGALFGDMFGSFIKRRIGLAQGRPAPILDQLGFVVFAILFAYLIAPISFEMVVMLIIITPIIHLFGNIVAYKLGFKKVWW